MSARACVRAFADADRAAWVDLRRHLWPGEDVTSPAAQAHALDASAGRGVLLAVDDVGQVVGFVELAIRRDYVNGTVGSPVGFLEGWYVVPDARGKGVGRALVDAALGWSRSHGCVDFASDALLENAAAHAAHRACGFEETDRVVYFRRPLA